MAVTGFLSMWLSNTACAAMMIPIACAVLKALNEHRKNLQNARRQGYTSTPHHHLLQLLPTVFHDADSHRFITV